MHFLDKKLCSGCAACAQACGKKAISMAPDKNGFLYPQIDENACVKCGLCEKACPVLHLHEQKTIAAYAAMGEDSLRQESSSGGVFSLIAAHILNQGGGVFGPAFDDNLELTHILVEQPEDLKRLRGSKYVQSRVSDSYQQAKALLKQGLPVLYTGTPCQINGLRSYLGRDYENLYCQDIICHGVPAPGVWAKYVAYREQQAGGKAVSVNFRCKDSGWRSYQMRMEFENGQVYTCPFPQDPYMQAFLGDLCLRESCYNCSAKGDRHTADLTLGDFWGVEQVLPEMHDGQGTSLVLIHTPKGQALFDAIKAELKTCPIDAAVAIGYNPAMIRSSNRPKNREKFLKVIMTGDFQKNVKKYRPKHPIRKLKAVIKKIIKR